MDLDTVWSLWQRGMVAPALMVAFHVANTGILARWTWLSTAFPWLANSRWLAVASAVQGATAGLVPLAVANDLTMAAVVTAAITALAQYLRPTPKVVMIRTDDQAKVEVVRAEGKIDRAIQPEAPV